MKQCWKCGEPCEDYERLCQECKARQDSDEQEEFESQWGNQ